MSLSSRTHRTSGPRAIPRWSVVVATATMLALGGMSPAVAVNADHGNRVVSDDPANFTPQVMDGSVQSFVQVGEKIVAAGTFTTVRQSPTSPDITRNGIFAFDADTGLIDPGFDPDLGGSANSLDTDGTHIYVGGSFGSVGGVTSARRLARLSLDGDLVPGLRTPNAAVNEVVVRDDRLFVGGKFDSIQGTPRGAFAVLDTGTGAVLPSVDVPFTGVYNGGGTGITRLDVDPAGTQVVAVGNFVTVAGQPREQIAIVDTPAGGQATVSSWSTERFSKARNNCATSFDTWTRDVDISPDGTYFAVTTTGAFAGGSNSGTLCDTVTRWELDRTGGNQEPTWADYSGGDTIYGVAITGSVVYVGGHMRWFNNSFQGDQAGPGAVPRDGIAALDPVNGLPLSWNPGRERGVGAQALYATDQGLWVGSDTRRIAGELRQRLALMPLAGGRTLATVAEPTLPNDVFAAPRTAAGGTNVLYRVNAGGGPVQSSDAGPDWSGDAGFVSGGNTASWGSTVPSDPTVPAGAPPQIFTSERWAGQDWAFPVAPGRGVTVNLYFANQCGCTSGVGQRVFDVLIDGSVRLDDFDIVASTGDRRGTMRSFAVTSDGTVDIDLRNVVENPLINGIEIVSGDAPATTGPAALVRRNLDAAGAPTGAASDANTTMDWSLVRGAALVDRTLYYGRSDGSLYKRSFDPATAAVGAETGVTLYDDPDDGGRIPFAISNLTGMVYDTDTHRLYYTLFGDSRLFYRYFTPESEVVGAQTFTAPTNGIDFGSAAGFALASDRLLFGSRADGSLRSVPFTDGVISGAPTVVSDDGTWRYRDLFMSTTSTQPPPPPPANEAPTASFESSCTERVCSFDAGASEDPDGTIAGYAWDFGDGSTGSGQAVDRTYTADGSYTVSLTVTDDDGASTSTTRQVSVSQAPPPNQAPAASFESSCTERVCAFDASGSTDPDGNLESYAWEFGDSTAGSGQTASRTYATDGSYTVTLTVTDNGGLTSSTTRTVTVAQAPPPAGAIAFRDAASTSGNLVTSRVGVPDTVAAGDALVLTLTQNAARTVTAPAGAGTWTELGTQVGDRDQIRTTTWVKVAEANDAGRVVSVTLGSRAKVTLSLVAYTGTDATDPVLSYTSAPETRFTADHTTPDAVDVPAGAWIVSGWADKTSATTAWSDPAGTTERVEAIGSGAGRVTSQIADSGPVASAGSSQGVTATALSGTAGSASRKATTWTLVLTP